MDICREDVLWSVTQQREQNLRSFQGQTVVRRRGTKRVSSKVFEPWQLAVAVQVLVRKDTA